MVESAYYTIVVSLNAHRRQRNLKQELQRHQQQLQQQKEQQQRNPDVDFQLSLIRSKRSAYLGKIVNYNPCYEFAGNRYTMNDLKTVPRTNITLVK